MQQVKILQSLFPRRTTVTLLYQLTSQCESWHSQKPQYFPETSKSNKNIFKRIDLPGTPSFDWASYRKTRNRPQIAILGNRKTVIAKSKSGAAKIATKVFTSKLKLNLDQQVLRSVIQSERATIFYPLIASKLY